MSIALILCFICAMILTLGSYYFIRHGEDPSMKVQWRGMYTAGVFLLGMTFALFLRDHIKFS